MKHIIAIFLTTLAIGCGSIESKEAEPKHGPVVWTLAEVTPTEIAMTKTKVVNVLKDPDSAKFGDFWALDSSNGRRSICGYVNAKNSFGGYTGKKVFISVQNNIYIEGKGFLGTLVPNMCTPRTVK